MEIYRMPLQEIIWDDFKIIATIHSLSQNNILLLKYIFYKKKEDEYVVLVLMYANSSLLPMETAS